MNSTEIPTQTKIEVGYIVQLPKGRVAPVKFVRGGGARATGVDPKTGKDSWLHGYWTIGKDIFITAEEAIAAAEETKAKRIASLRKQISKLEGMTVKVAQA